MLLLLWCALAGIVVPAAGKPLLWLPLGDSITLGCGTDSPPHGADNCPADAGGYRVPTAWALSQAGHNVTTMGTLRNGPAYVPAQWLSHGGHDGWRTDQVAAVLNASLATALRPPDLVTIHLGTNDCYQGASVELIKTRLTALLSRLRVSAPEALVLVATILHFPRNAPCVAAFNAALPSLVAAQRAAGWSKLVLVPMQEQTGLCTTDAPLTDLCCHASMHPTAAGYLRMASAWALAVAVHSAV